MRRKLPSILIAITVSVLLIPNANAGIDLQADLNRIIAGISRFDANSASSGSVNTMSGVRRLFSNNASILRDIRDANTAFKRDLNSAKSQIPSRDTSASPGFSTLMNLTKGYEEWLKYQNLNQANAQKCIDRAGISFDSFSACSISILPETMDNERKGRLKLQTAWNAWKKWQVKYGYA